MKQQTVNETDRLVVTKAFGAPRELDWKAWTDPNYLVQWWGPNGFTSSFCKMDFRVGGKLPCCMRSPNGREFRNGFEYDESVPHEKVASSMYFSEPEGNRVEPTEYGIEHEAIEGVYGVVTFNDLENGLTKLTFTGNETTEQAKNSGQLDSSPPTTRRSRLRQPCATIMPSSANTGTQGSFLSKPISRADHSIRRCR